MRRENCILGCGSSGVLHQKRYRNASLRRTCVYALRNETSMSRAIVIGGGAGGMATAGRLGALGLKVILLEQRDVVGGRISSEYLYENPNVDNGKHSSGGQWRFDTGPSLLLFPDKYKETFEALGVQLDTAVDLKRVSPAAYRVFFPSSPGFRIDLLNDKDAMSEQLEQLEKGSGLKYLKFLEMAKSNLELGLPYFIDRDFSSLTDARGLLDLIPKLPNINPFALLGPHDFVMRSFFKDPRIRAAFTFQDLYVGLSPSSAPGVFSLLAGTELIDGIYYPVGGFGAIRDALLQSLQSNGVEIRTKSQVLRIDVGRDNRVMGVTLANGEKISSDIVVCNRDLPAAYSLLRTDDNFKSSDSLNTSSTGFKNERINFDMDIEEYASIQEQRLLELQYSDGIIEFNWAIRGNITELSHHNVFLSEEFRKAWRSASKKSEFVKYPNFYVHVPSKTDPSAAPEGCESVMVLLPVANMQLRTKENKMDYGDLIEAGRELVIDSMQASGVNISSDMIVREMVISPPEWQKRYGLQHGAAFGLAHGLGQLSLFRPSPVDPVVQGLYFVGASTRPGNGVPLCFIGAKLTANRIIRDMELQNAL